nr:response regulator transcription factor [Chitinophagaceae bacterium]
MIRVLIADDHPIFRTGVREILHQSSLVELIGEASNGLEAYQLILSLRPDVAILDLEMPLLTGLDVCQKVIHEKSNTRFIILTMHKEQSYFDAAMQAGVNGYLLKDSASVNLVECISAVHRQQTFVSPDIEQLLTLNQAQQSIDHILK